VGKVLDDTKTAVVVGVAAWFLEMVLRWLTRYRKPIWSTRTRGRWPKPPTPDIPGRSKSRG